MSNRNAVVALALLAIAIGCIVVVAVRWHGGDAPVAQQPNRVQTAPATIASDTTPPADAPGAQPAAEAPPPWMQSDAPVTRVADTSDASDTLRQEQMQRLNASVSGLIAIHNAGAAERNRHLREALDALEALDDPAVKAQIDMPALRENFEISVRVQALAMELQKIAAQPRTPERKARMDATMAEIRALHARMNTDVLAPGAASRR